MGPFGKLTQHVSYRRAVGLLKYTAWYCRDVIFCDAGRTFVDVPLKTLAWEQPKSMLHAYLHIQINLIFQEFMKSPDSTWETFWTPRRPPGATQGPPGDHPGTTWGPPGDHLGAVGRGP